MNLPKFIVKIKHNYDACIALMNGKCKLRKSTNVFQIDTKLISVEKKFNALFI